MGYCVYIDEDSFTIVSVANLIMVLEWCVATQSWVNSVYMRVLSTHP